MQQEQAPQGTRWARPLRPALAAGSRLLDRALCVAGAVLAAGVLPAIPAAAGRASRRGPATAAGIPAGRLAIRRQPEPADFGCEFPKRSRPCSNGERHRRRAYPGRFAGCSRSRSAQLLGLGTAIRVSGPPGPSNRARHMGRLQTRGANHAGRPDLRGGGHALHAGALSPVREAGRTPALDASSKVGVEQILQVLLFAAAGLGFAEFGQNKLFKFLEPHLPLFDSPAKSNVVADIPRSDKFSELSVGDDP